jgi:hypothetical protein
MRCGKRDSVAAAALITLIGMRRFVCSAALGVTGGGL